MDLVDIISEKRFLGQEFLTWLWWKSEQRGGTVEIPGESDITISFEKHMLLESGEGESSEKLICSGLQTELQEARTGLRMGKKLEQARIVIGLNNEEYSFTLGAAQMEFRNVRLPKTETTEASLEGGDSRVFEAMVLERVFLFEELVRVVNGLFRIYLNTRIDSSWISEREHIRNWVEKSATIGE